MQEQAYELAKDILYNVDQRPSPVRLLVICPQGDLAYRVDRHLRSLIAPVPYLRPVEDSGVRMRFKNGSQVTIISRHSIGEEPRLYEEGERIA